MGFEERQKLVVIIDYHHVNILLSGSFDAYRLDICRQCRSFYLRQIETTSRTQLQSVMGFVLGFFFRMLQCCLHF